MYLLARWQAPGVGGAAGGPYGKDHFSDRSQMMSKVGRARPVTSDSSREKMCRRMKLCRWGHAEKGGKVARGQSAEEAGMARTSSSRGSSRCGNSVPSAGRRELLRDFPEEVTMVRFIL